MCVKLCVEKTGSKCVLKFNVEIYSCLEEAKYSNTMKKTKQERKTQTLITNDVDNGKLVICIMMLIMERFFLYMIIIQSCWYVLNEFKG